MGMIHVYQLESKRVNAEDKMNDDGRRTFVEISKTLSTAGKSILSRRRGGDDGSWYQQRRRTLRRSQRP